MIKIVSKERELEIRNSERHTFIGWIEVLEARQYNIVQFLDKLYLNHRMKHRLR